MRRDRQLMGKRHGEYKKNVMRNQSIVILWICSYSAISLSILSRSKEWIRKAVSELSFCLFVIDRHSLELNSKSLLGWFTGSDIQSGKGKGKIGEFVRNRTLS